MKKIVVAVALIVVAAVSVPFASGLLLEKYVRSAFTDMNAIYAEAGTGCSLEIINYERNYTTSIIEWKIDLGVLKTIYPIGEVIFVDHAEHGFSGIVSTTSLEKNPWFTSFVDEKLQGPNPLHISTVYGYLGNIETTIVSDAFSAIFEDEKVDVNPARLAIVTDYKLQHFNSTGEWQGLSAGEKMAVGPTSVASNVKMLSPFLWDGDFNFEVQHVKAQEKEEQFELKGVKGNYRIDVNRDQSLMSGEAFFSIDGFTSKNMKIDNAKVRFSAGGLRVESYVAFMKIYTQTMSKFFADMAALEAQPEKSKEMMNQQMAAIGFQMVAAYEKLMQAGFELKISDLEVKLAEGDISGDITLRFLKDMTFMQLIPIASQPELLLDLFYLKSNCSLPVKLVGDNPKLVTPAYSGMQTGLFVKSGDYLVHQAETAGGKLIVNSAEVILTQ